MKGERCIFIGYVTSSKTYKLYNLKTKKVIINQDVTFDEKGMKMVILNNYEENERSLEWKETSNEAP
ncbi:hypothetical protein CR513_50789, partial [Mucuna pruriens]